MSFPVAFTNAWRTRARHQVPQLVGFPGSFGFLRLPDLIASIAASPTLLGASSSSPGSLDGAAPEGELAVEGELALEGAEGELAVEGAEGALAVEGAEGELAV